MDIVRRFFPFSTRATDVIGLIITIIIYALIPVVLGIISALLGGIPIIGWLINIIMSVIDLYCFIGIVLAILIFCKVIK